MARCKLWKCNIEENIKSILQVYYLMAKDSRKLQHYVVYQYEGFVADPVSVLGHVDDVLGMHEVPEVGPMAFSSRDSASHGRRLGFHDIKDEKVKRKHGTRIHHTNGYKEPVTVYASESMLKWQRNFSLAELQRRPQILAVLKKYEKQLNFFGYRYDSLVPINHKDPKNKIQPAPGTFEHPYIWKKSDAKLKLSLDDAVKKEQVRKMMDKYEEAKRLAAEVAAKAAAEEARKATEKHNNGTTTVKQATTAVPSTGAPAVVGRVVNYVAAAPNAYASQAKNPTRQPKPFENRGKIPQFHDLCAICVCIIMYVYRCFSVEYTRCIRLADVGVYGTICRGV